jgi:CDP-diacylglycerol--glycerol-3-phosphate 3-phosphatidyltransferase
MYNHFSRNFLEDVVGSRNEGRVHYWEYLRPGWTFHGKGMWFYPQGEEWPVATLVGSSNYGEGRSDVKLN